jgi:mono/diheme cytochrome c family protein
LTSEQLIHVLPSNRDGKTGHEPWNERLKHQSDEASEARHGPLADALGDRTQTNILEMGRNHLEIAIHAEKATSPTVARRSIVRGMDRITVHGFFSAWLTPRNLLWILATASVTERPLTADKAAARILRYDLQSPIPHPRNPPMMRVSGLIIVWLTLAAAAVAAGDAAWPGNHPLSQAQAGDLLVAEFRCAACHSGVQPDGLFSKTAPDLTSVGARISPHYLRKFLASPSSIHPGTTMPDVLASSSKTEREEIAEALTHFLVAASKDRFPTELADPSDPQAGKALFHAVGCVACHGPKEPLAEPPLPATPDGDDEDDDSERPPPIPIAPVAIPLGHVAGKYSVPSLSRFLFQPLRVRSSGRMPDMKLTPAESLAIASYLIGERPAERVDFVPTEPLVTLGRKFFQEQNCGACHTIPGIEPAPLVGSLKDANFARGCLTTMPGHGPRFHLAEPQIKAIHASLQRNREADPDSLVVAKTMTAFRCIACHVRDDYGGVPDDYNAFFTGSEHNLGDDGRIPPPLTLVGAKLRPAWMKKVLFDGESVRPYMATRMPQYGESNLQHLPPLLRRLDVLQSVEMEIPPSENRTPREQELEKQLRAAGRELLGDKGLNCIACHRFNGKPAQANQGIDLMTTYPRLEPGWFNRYLRNPGEFRPRTIMPSAWPNGVAIHKTILDGNTDRQIEAIWYYLSLGTSAADPPGVRPVDTKVTVGDRARTHRGRSRVAGFRGIAVGLPEKLSYAFNAETGTLTAIWQGEFIDVNWSGQGSGDFKPSRTAVTLPQDVSFARLADDRAPWPMMPVMTKEARTNPDPLYPKNLGYQFRGYFLGDRSIPTFQYRMGTIEVEDRSEAGGREEPVRLKRTLNLQSPTPQTIWFRALTGTLRKESDHVFASDSLRMTIPAADTTMRPLPDEPERSELLLKLNVPEGISSLEFTYELVAP